MVYEEFKTLCPNLIIFFTILGFASFIIQSRVRFTEKYDAAYWSWAYSVSQYVLGEKAERGMSDNELYAYAGWHYIRGGDPIGVNFDHPPLGKYLLGLSIVLFNNPLAIFIPIGASLLIVFNLLALKLFQNKLIAFVSVLIFSFDPLFREHLTTTLLDLPLVLFFCLP